jgi:chromosomal replication initiation ATPase DnaA
MEELFTNHAKTFRIMKIEDIIKKCCEINGITVDEVKSKRRYRPLPDGRKQICVAIKKITTLSLEDVGKFVNVDHATVIDYHKKHLNLIDTDIFYREKYAKLKEYIEQIKGGFDPFMYRNSIMISLKKQGL